jgi:catechol 2,3-dioxygenase-like lactoylglutathione lyase family enzyme
MLGDHDAIPTLAVRDLDAARRFYEGKLGLEPLAIDEQSGVVRYRSGRVTLMIYRSGFAGSNAATSISFAVGKQVDALVSQLAEAGVVFERYDTGGARHEGHVHVWGDYRTAWFKDPDGNILSLVSD